MNPPYNNEYWSESSWTQPVITCKHKKAKKDTDTNGCLEKGLIVSFLVDFLNVQLKMLIIFIGF